MASYNNNRRSQKYQKHQNKTNNLHDFTINSYNHNKKGKSNNLDENSNKNSYETNNIIITETITLMIIITKIEIRMKE